MLLNIAIFGSSKNEYTGGLVPDATRTFTGLQEGTSIWISTIVLSVVGVFVHSIALWADSKRGTAKAGRSVLRDDNFHRSSFIKSLLLAAKLQLVTTSMTCVCEPNSIDSFHELGHYRAACDSGSSFTSILYRAVLIRFPMIELMYSLSLLILLELIYNLFYFKKRMMSTCTPSIF